MRLAESPVTSIETVQINSYDHKYHSHFFSRDDRGFPFHFYGEQI